MSLFCNCIGAIPKRIPQYQSSGKNNSKKVYKWKGTYWFYYWPLKHTSGHNCCTWSRIDYIIVKFSEVISCKRINLKFRLNSKLPNQVSWNSILKRFTFFKIVSIVFARLTPEKVLYALKFAANPQFITRIVRGSL